MTFPAHDYAARRRRALERMGERGALVLPASPHVTVGRETELPYVVDPNLNYLTGCTDPEAIAVITASAPKGPFVLFARERDAEAERWTGPRESPEALGERLGADAVFPVRALRDELPRLLRGADVLHFPLDWGRDDVEHVVRELLVSARRTRQRSGRGPQAVADPGAVVDELRLRKDEAELARMRAAARVTVDAFAETAAALADARDERQVQALIEYGFRRRGASGAAFPTIAAAGVNATILHYTRNDAPVRATDLVLLDAGATVDHYHADVTRTWSAGGRASAAQNEVHAVVARAHRAAVAAVHPGATEAGVHRAALTELLRGMEELGLLRETANVALATEDERLRARPSESETTNSRNAQRPEWTRWFPHRVSHWLGLEVHDVGDYAVRGESRVLEPGMVLTIEPGLYVPDDDERAPAAMRGTGVRIEDDVLVVPDGAEVLTAGLSTGVSAA